MGLLSKRYCQFVQMVPRNWTIWLPCPYMYMVKTLKNLLLQECFEAGSWYTASGTQGLPTFVKMMRLEWPLTFLWYGQICGPVAVAILEDCCMAFANMQVSELWPMGLLFVLDYKLVWLWFLLWYVFLAHLSKSWGWAIVITTRRLPSNR